MAKCLACLSAILILSSGCCSQPVDHAIGLPAEPQLIEIDQELWDAVPLHVQTILLHNRLAWETFYDSALGRILLHDERMQD